MKILCICDLGILSEAMAPMKDLEKYGNDVSFFDDQQMLTVGDISKVMRVYEKSGADAIAANPELLKIVKDVDILVIHTTVVNTAVIQAASNLKIIATLRSGTTNIAEALCKEREIKIINAVGRNAHAVADCTVGLLLAESRNIARGHKSIKDGGWCKQFLNQKYTHDLRKCTIGIIGAGRIGQQVIDRLVGFGCRIIVHDPFITDSEISGLGYEPVSLEDLLAQSDFVSIHMRMSEKTQNFIAKREFDMMKKTAYFINTSRSSLVNEADLIEALQNRTIGGAALDVFNDEPLSAGSPFLKLENVTMTPHLAGSTEDAFANSVEIIKDELEKIFENGVGL